MHQQPAEHGPDPALEPSQPPGQRSHTLAAPVLRFDLRSEKEQLRKQASYQKGDPTGKTLVKEPDLRIVLMTLRAGARFEEHQASGPVSIHAMEGRLRLRLPATAVELTAGEIVALEPHIRHEVEAVDDAVFLLTIGRTTYEQVSDRHERKG